jgi:hypothetical protein
MFRLVWDVQGVPKHVREKHGVQDKAKPALDDSADAAAA